MKKQKPASRPRAAKAPAKKFNTKPLMAIIAVVIVGGGGYMLLRGQEKNYPDFTACMVTSGLIEIGSDTCLHCENEKRILGHDAFLIFDNAGKYYRCNKDPQLCADLGIRGTPTFYMPSATGKRIDVDGKIFSIHGTFTEHLGEQSIQDLSTITNCPLPANYDATKAIQSGGYTGS